MTPTARPPRLISVLHISEESGVHPESHGRYAGQTWHERDETSYYAVLQPADAWDRWNEGEEARMDGSSTPSYAVYGGQSVHIYGQTDIDGLRKLLDAIEADLKEEK